jgi:hypothetical protein
VKLALVPLVFGACADDGTGPRLHDVTPAQAAPGAAVALAGERFCGGAGECESVAAIVDLGLDPPLLRARVLAYAASSATIEIPALATPGATSLVLTVDGRSSNALDFEVLP